MKKEKTDYLLIFLIALLTIFAFVVFGLLHPYTPKIQQNYALIDNSLATREEIHKELDKIFNVEYTYSEGWIKYNVGGTTTWGISKFPAVKINTAVCINNYEYAGILAHELTHVKYPNLNEKNTEFISIKILYESEIPYLKNVALFRAHQRVLLGEYKEYNCSQELIEYFNSQGGKNGI